MQILCPSAVQKRIGKNPGWQRRQIDALKESRFYTVGNWNPKFEYLSNIGVL